MGEPNQEGINPRQLTVPSAVDPSPAIALAAPLAEINRFDFARRFSESVVTAYWEIHYPSEVVPTSRLRFQAPVGAVLTIQATLAAYQIAAGLTSLPLPAATDAIGRLYAALLSQAYRAQYGIYYVPSEMVGSLLAIAEDCGITSTLSLVIRLI